MSALSPRAIAARGAGFEPRVYAALGLWTIPDKGGSNAGARSGRRWLTDSERRARERRRLDEVMEQLERALARRPVNQDAEPIQTVADRPVTFATDQEAVQQVLKAIQTLQTGRPLPEPETAALRAVFDAAQRRADTSTKQRGNRWRAIVLVALLLLS